jgi:DNA-binding NarL/FixJ family response regulator
MENNGSRPLRVALVNDYEIILRGLAEMLAPFSDRLAVVELAAGHEPVEPVDIALFDTYGHRSLGLSRVAELAKCETVGHVVVFTWDSSPDHVRQALDVGVTGFLSKGVGADQLIADLQRVAAGEVIVRAERERSSAPRTWPGRERGLTERESELLAMVARGERNRDVAEALFLSENTVKTHLKTIFRKLGVSTRTQAAAVALSDPSFSRR